MSMALEVQPRVQDIPQGRPYRIVGIPLPADTLNNPAYHLEISADDSYGATVLFTQGPNPLPAFTLTGQQTTSSLAIIMSSCSRMWPGPK